MTERTSTRTKEIKKITRWDFFKVFFASFFVQAAWNFRSLISIGFSTCLFPILNKLYPQNEDKQKFFKRHLRFFNAHPYFASYALGVSIKLEEMVARGESPNPEVLSKIKDLLISPLGAVGDRLFWATIKPTSLIFGMVGVFLAPSIPLKFTALVLTFLLYNIPHLYFRYNGIIEGYKYGIDIYKYLGQHRFEKLRKIYLNLLLILILFLIIVYVFSIYNVQKELVLIFFFSTLYAFIFNKLINNFYLVCLASFTFFMLVGILFL